MNLFQPSAQHGAYPPQLYNMKRAAVMKDMPQFERLSDFLDGFVIRTSTREMAEALAEEDKTLSGLTMADGEATKKIEDFDYSPMIKEAGEFAKQCLANPTNKKIAAYMFFYRAIARHIAAVYLHIDQYRKFVANFDRDRNFLHQNFGLAKDRVPEGLETLVLDTEKATRGYGPADDTKKLLEDGKLSFVLAYPDYACAYCAPGSFPSDVHKLDPIAYMLGGKAEKYFKLLHLAVESKLGPFVAAAQAMIDGSTSEKRAALIHKAADAAREATSTIIKIPDLSSPSEYLHLRWFIQGPYNSPSYPNGLTVRGVCIRPGGETGSQSSFAIMSDLLSGARFQFQEDSLSKMEEIHRLTREQKTITFLDDLRAAAQQQQAPDKVCSEEKYARARLLQATNFYLLGHAAAYTIHVLAQQKSTVNVDRYDKNGNDTEVPEAKRARKEDVATGGSAGGFLIKKVLERQSFLEKMIKELEGTTSPFKDTHSNELFKKQLEAVKAHTQGENRESLDMSYLRELVNYSDSDAVGITAADESA